MLFDPSFQAHQLVATDHAYPRALCDLPDAPLSIWVAGSLESPSPALALVGTRRADPESLRLAERFAFDAASAGQVVVSGGAMGIDAAAHRGALLAKGRTIAVLASGLDPVYPLAHRRLFAEIIERGGALLSECEAGTPPRAGTFLRRNRLIAALADATVVVQAPLKSGALSTAAWARRLSRHLFVVPASPFDEDYRGNLELLQRGARPICEFRELEATCDTPAAPEHLSADAGERRLAAPFVQAVASRPVPCVVRPSVSTSPASTPLRLSPAAAAVAGALRRRPRGTDELVEAVCAHHGPAPRVFAALSELVVKGVAVHLPGDRYRLDPAWTAATLRGHLAAETPAS